MSKKESKNDHEQNANQDSFIGFLEAASNEVKQWPVWKKSLLGGVSTPASQPASVAHSLTGKSKLDQSARLQT